MTIKYNNQFFIIIINNLSIYTNHYKKLKLNIFITISFQLCLVNLQMEIYPILA